MGVLRSEKKNTASGSLHTVQYLWMLLHRLEHKAVLVHEEAPVPVVLLQAVPGDLRVEGRHVAGEDLESAHPR